MDRIPSKKVTLSKRTKATPQIWTYMVINNVGNHFCVKYYGWTFSYFEDRWTKCAKTHWPWSLQTWSWYEYLQCDTSPRFQTLIWPHSDYMLRSRILPQSEVLWQLTEVPHSLLKAKKDGFLISSLASWSPRPRSLLQSQSSKAVWNIIQCFIWALAEWRGVPLPFIFDFG